MQQNVSIKRSSYNEMNLTSLSSSVIILSSSNNRNETCRETFQRGCTYIFGQIVKQRRCPTMALIYFSNLTNSERDHRFTIHRIHRFFPNPLRTSFCRASRKPGRILKPSRELKVHFTTGRVLYETLILPP